MAGHGSVSTRYPPCPFSTGSPASSTTTAEIPGSAFIAEPGLPDVTPGKGLIISWPVSVCHHVSTIGQRPPPIELRYHMYASGLIDSPTEPSSRSDERSNFSGISEPHFMKVRIAVGAQYRMFTLYFSMISHHRPL